MKILRVMSVFIFIGLFLTSAAFAEETAQAPQMSAEQQEMMAKVKERTSPNENHKALEVFAGNWTYTAKFWMDANAQPEETTGSAAQEMVYGGRFLRQTVSGTWMGAPFEGTGYLGYDNIKQEYVSVWIDSMGTGIMTESGTYDAAAKTFKMNGKNSCPMTGEKDRACRSEIAQTDDDHYTYSAYIHGPDGEEFKGMEIVYTRA